MTDPAFPVLAKMAAEAEALNAYLDELLPNHDQPEKPLFAAMRHGVLAGGKRMRPFLTLTAASLFNVKRERALRVAAAIECVHAYSLIHDDLPAMDDADTRRGYPSVHRAFDEATAILAGDGLLTFAFEILAHPSTHEDSGVRIQLVHGLAQAAGTHGMVAGQMMDLWAETADDEALSATTITRLQRLKTGELITFAAEAGAILGRAGTTQRHALIGFARDLGLTFQILDDILDHTSTAQALGKPSGQDQVAGKATFVRLLGLDQARDQARRLTAQAKRHLDVFEGRATLLSELADAMLARTA